MKIKGLSTVLAIAMSVNLIFGIAGGSSLSVNAAEELDLNKEMSISVDVSDDVQKRINKLKEDDGQLIYDLYKVADLKEKGSGFAYEVTEKYSYMANELSKMATGYTGEDRMKWSELSQLAMQNTLGKEGNFVNAPVDADYTGIGFKTKQSVTKGLYLVIVRGSIENSTVVKSMAVSNSDVEDTEQITQQFSTYTLLGTSTFTAQPTLICVPTKLAANGEIAGSTIDDGDWNYDVKVSLKMNADPATGSIKINKSLVGGYYSGAENATFVFRVDTFFPNEQTLFSSEVYSTTFTGLGKKTIQVDGLPIGATVKIYEEYSGANYSASIDKSKSLNVIVKEDEIEEVEIINTYNRRTNGGGGITNHFQYDVTDVIGNWIWFNKTDNTETMNGVSSKFLSIFSNPVLP